MARRRAIAVMGLLSMLGVGASAQAAEPAPAGQLCRLKVSGLACGACAARVEKVAKAIDGVKSATVSQPKGTADIAYDPAKTSPEAIAKIITRKAGFAAHVQSNDSKD